MLSIVNNDYPLPRLLNGLTRRASVPFSENLRVFLGTPNCTLASCGFAALHRVLQIMAAARPNRNEVILPAYAAPGLVLPVQRLGLRVRLCDVFMDTFTVDITSLAKAVTDDTLAVIPVHLFGIPVDIAAVRKAIGPGIFIIEDGAQSLGSETGGNRASAAADAVFGSFGRGKNFSLYYGGFYSLNAAELRDAARYGAGELLPSSAGTALLSFVKHLIFSGVTEPLPYSFLHAPLACLKSGREQAEYTRESFENRLDRSASALFDLWKTVFEQRILNGEYFLRTFAALKGMWLPAIPHAARAAFNRFPLLVHDSSLLPLLLRNLSGAGIEGSVMYGKPLHVLHALGYAPGAFPSADHLARHLLTLPVHGRVRQKDIVRMAETIRRTLS